MGRPHNPRVIETKSESGLRSATSRTKERAISPCRGLEDPNPQSPDVGRESIQSPVSSVTPRVELPGVSNLQAKFGIVEEKIKINRGCRKMKNKESRRKIKNEKINTTQTGLTLLSLPFLIMMLPDAVSGANAKHEGWGKKLGGWRKNWKRRYFVLFSRRREIDYHSNEYYRPDNLEGTINLALAADVTATVK